MKLTESKSQTSYTEQFYERYTDSSQLSASIVVPLVVDLVRPGSVVDVGCGEGVWLSVFRENGVEKVFGIDGDYVNRQRLRIPSDCFLARDLAQPFTHSERFSLVVSLEVAEHLSPASAETFVESLTQLGDVVLFSAAIPFQGGTNHINLQWQDYWAKQFDRHGYVAVDAVRPLIWEEDRVSFWYRQNTLLYVEHRYLATQPALMKARERTHDRQLSMVHPLLASYLGGGAPSKEQLDGLYLGQVLPRLPAMSWRALTRRLKPPRPQGESRSLDSSE